MNKTIICTLVVLTMAFSYGMIDDISAEFSSPKQQIKSGVTPADVQCNEGKVLAALSNIKVACIYESTAEKKNWNIIATEFKKQPIVDTSIDKIPESTKSISPTIVMIDQSSDVEFVDDGREINYKSAGGLASPRELYQYVIGKQMKHSEFQNDGEGMITLAMVSHEKYSLKPNKTLYLEDWLPDYVPDGYKLLYSQTDWSEKNQRSSVIHQYVPTTFELTEDFDTIDLVQIKGFEIGVSKYTYEIGTVEDRIKHTTESLSRFGGHYGTGFVDMYRDGKLIYAYSGGTTHHWYQAALSMNTDEYTSFIVSTNYLTIDELLPIFNSVGN